MTVDGTKRCDYKAPVITDSKETRNEIFDFLFYNQRPWLDYIVSASGPIETSQCSPSGRRDMRLSPQWPRPFTFDLKTVPSVILLRLAISPLNFNFVKVLYVFELTDSWTTCITRNAVSRGGPHSKRIVYLSASNNLGISIIEWIYYF